MSTITEAGPEGISLQIFEELEQGTPEWFAERCGIPTASIVGQLVTAKTFKPAENETARSLTNLLVAERITGHVVEGFTSSAMERGHFDEPFAREVYHNHHAPVTEVGFMVRDDFGFKLGYSPDGLVGDNGLIEIKSREPKIHLATILADAVPDANMAQLQCGLLVSGREWIDYVSFCGGMPLWTKRVFPDLRWHFAIIAAVGLLERNAANIMSRYLEAVEGLPMTERIEPYEEMRF